MSSIPSLKTADLCDDLSPDMQIAEPVFCDFGGHPAFHGPVTFAGVTFRPGARLVADADGIVVTDSAR